MNLVLVVLWSLAMPYCRFRTMASCLSTVWVCVIIVCKMLYQLSVVNPDEYSHNCTMVRDTQQRHISVAHRCRHTNKDGGWMCYVLICERLSL